ncbi:zinc ABC transporter substrate-binding protein [Streptomyces massasporeus]|uniref:metal ABC transporter solute-binding protein, Zn/Mn family n=1 Tax=Streptomyces massasporeus TaxID=67324 RepID=UPI0033C1881E
MSLSPSRRLALLTSASLALLAGCGRGRPQEPAGAAQGAGRHRERRRLRRLRRPQARGRTQRLRPGDQRGRRVRQNRKGGDLNEHVWYDFPTVAKVAGPISRALTEADPGDAAVFEKNTAAFKAKLAPFQAREAQIKKAHGGEGVAITEPVPPYMIEASGLVNGTPAQFSEATVMS